MTDLDEFVYGKKNQRDKRRAFTQTQKNEILAQQGNRCAGPHCGHKPLDPRAIEYHHMKGWADKGKTATANGAALCPNCHSIITHEERLKKVEPKISGRKVQSRGKTTSMGTQTLETLKARYSPQASAVSEPSPVKLRQESVGSQVKCPNCKGKGTLRARDIWSDDAACPSCRKKGTVMTARSAWVKCPKCKGYGSVGLLDERCPNCRGAGIVPPNATR